MATETDERARTMTIGAVCRRLREEFPDVSISKIRYLEDQGLLSLRRTRGGYRLFSEEDLERLRTILRLQRDEFLPLRVIRQELTSPGARRDRRRRHAGSALRTAEREVGLEELCRRSGATPAFVRELEEYRILEPVGDTDEPRYLERDVEIVSACLRLSRHVDVRHLRKFRIGADNEADLLRQVLAPQLLSPRPEQRHAGLEDLEELGALSQELSQHLFWRALRSLVSR